MRFSLLIPMLAAGCAPVDGSPPVHGAGSCEASGAQSLVGQPATADLAARARDMAGAKTVRWLRPGMIVTMEYRSDRLNIEIGEGNRVIAIRCG